MFAWYRDSAMCYVYLDIDTDAEYLTAEDFKACRWTYRGWTLQELIAPSRLRFYSRFWLFLGTRQQLAQALHETTNIHISVLQRSEKDVLNLASHCVARKMSWAAARETTRPEDIAYAMFGLFGVHLPPLYGEGAEKAFLRLQHEILSVSTDLSILAWTTDSKIISDEGALALTPKSFEGCETIVSFSSFVGDKLVSTNRGLSVTVPMIEDSERSMVEDSDQWTYTAMLNCRYEHDFTKVIGIPLDTTSLHHKETYSRATTYADGKAKNTICLMDPDTSADVQWKTIHIISLKNLFFYASTIVDLLGFEMSFGPSTPDLRNDLKICVPPVGLWDPGQSVLQMPSGQLEDMDVLLTISLFHGGKQLPLFTLSIGPNEGVPIRRLKSGRYTGTKDSAILTIDGAQFLLRVSIAERGIWKDLHMMQVLLRFDNHPLQGTPQGEFRTREPDGISVRIKKVWANARAPLSSGSGLKRAWFK
jgi:hypothetical protein